MAYTANFTIFNKRLNSTKQPGGGQSWDAVSCKYKDGSDLDNPTLIVDWSGVVGATPETYNYVWMQTRFYFIQSRSYRLGLYEYQLKLDVLGTYKSQLSGQSFYIMRSRTNYNTYIPDGFYPLKTGVTFDAASNNSNPFATTFGSGYFVVGVINGDTSAYGAVSYYVLDSTQLRTLSAYLLGTTSYWGVTEISDQLLKCLYNPFQYVVSCTWLPFTPQVGTAVTTIKVGWWDIPVSGNRLSSLVRSGGTVSVGIPKHPNTTNTMDSPDETINRKYLQGEPYSTYYLDFPPFGAFSIPSSALVDKATLNFAWDCDCITGKGRLCMSTEGTAEYFNIVHADIGVPIQLSQMTPDVMSAVQSIIPSTKYDWLNTAMQTVGNIGSALIASQMPMQTTGSTGGFSAGYYPIRLIGTFAYTADENIDEFGRPTCKTIQLSTLTGFVQCRTPDVILAGATRPATEEVISLLESGIFWE